MKISIFMYVFLCTNYKAQSINSPHRTNKLKEMENIMITTWPEDTGNLKINRSLEDNIKPNYEYDPSNDLSKIKILRSMSKDAKNNFEGNIKFKNKFMRRKGNETAPRNATSETFNRNNNEIQNKMDGSSQIGDKKYQTFIKPSVIVNYFGTVSDVELDKPNSRRPDTTGRNAGHNTFYINQEVRLEKPNGEVKISDLPLHQNKIKKVIKRTMSELKNKVNDLSLTKDGILNKIEI